MKEIISFLELIKAEVSENSSTGEILFEKNGEKYKIVKLKSEK